MARSIGYRLLVNEIGEEYANIIHEIASKNDRCAIHIPVRFETAVKLKKVLPEHILKKLINSQLSGGRYYVKKENEHDEKLKLRQKATEILTYAGMSPRELKVIFNVSEKTILARYGKQLHKFEVVRHEEQLSLF